jgi:hypothetical protein
MSHRNRRILAAFALASAVLTAAPSHAAPREGRREPGATARLAPQGFSLWSFLSSLWEKAGIRIDNNGNS